MDYSVSLTGEGVDGTWKRRAGPSWPAKGCRYDRTDNEKLWVGEFEYWNNIT